MERHGNKQIELILQQSLTMDFYTTAMRVRCLRQHVGGRYVELCEQQVEQKERDTTAHAAKNGVVDIGKGVVATSHETIESTKGYDDEGQQRK